MKTLFLDIDGVLRRESAPKYKLEKHLVENLSRWVAEYEHKNKEEIEIVISSTWKEAFSLEYIRSLFPIDLRAKIIGSTPTMNGPHLAYPRFEEIKMFMTQQGWTDSDDWIAIDDTPTLFPPTKRLITVDPSVGFQG